MMLKLTMNPRRRSKRHRSIPHRLRLPTNPTAMETGDDEEDREKDMLAENIGVIIKQEGAAKYSCVDYLSLTVWQQSVYQLMKKSKADPITHHANTMIDEYCREQIVEWSFRVVDYFRIDREVVALSMSFLDRFLATCRCDRTSFKLAATTTLHLAVKLLYPCKLADLGILSDLSRGEFDMHDVTEMESHILHALEWNLHPPTSAAFTSLFLDYFFATRAVHVSNADLDDIYDVSSFFCELAICDYFFVPTRASAISLSAILNSLEGMYGPDNRLSHAILEAALELQVCGSGLIDLSAARNRLWELYERSEECALHNDKPAQEDIRQHGSCTYIKKLSATASPVSVSKPCHSSTDFSRTGHSSALRNESW
jgi:hypothetical protein